MRVFVCVIALTGCSASLPSRPNTGNHGQGHSPGADCPAQYAESVDEFFLYCWGKR